MLTIDFEPVIIGERSSEFRQVRGEYNEPSTPQRGKSHFFELPIIQE